MEEIILTLETCIPGTRVIPSEYTMKNAPDYLRQLLDANNGDPIIIGTVISLNNKLGPNIRWDNHSEKEEDHYLFWEHVAIYEFPITSESIITALDKLEEHFK